MMTHELSVCLIFFLSFFILIKMSHESHPSRYVIEDKHFALNNKFVITDESGGVYYTVDSTLFPKGNLTIYDATEKPVIRIRRQSLHLHAVYDIFSVVSDTEDVELASVKSTGAPWNHKLDISSTNGEYFMEKRVGTSDHEFVLKQNGDIVALVTKDTSPSKSTYWIDIAHDRSEYRAFLIALVIVLSCVQRLPGNPLATSHNGHVKM